MPNLRSVTATKDGISIDAGATWTVTRAQIKAYFQAQAGTPAQRKAATLAWLKADLLATLGEGFSATEEIGFDFDPTNDLADLRAAFGPPAPSED